MTFYTIEEVNQHNKSDDCWVISKSKVYNVTNLLINILGENLPFYLKLARMLLNIPNIIVKMRKKYGKNMEKIKNQQASF